MESSKQIEDTAAAWLARRDADSWGETGQREFDAWFNGSVAHRVAFLRLDATWRGADRLKALGAGVPAGVVPPAGSWKSKRFENAEAPRPRAWLRTLAASLIAVSLIGGAWWLVPSRVPSYSTGVGGLEAVPLPDGSQIMLNTDSEIRLAVTETERAVQLERGEAFFDVAKDPARPFVVYVADRRVVAVGTRFSVRREGDEARVVVTEGRVRVESAGSAASNRPPAQLEAGSIARTGGNDVIVETKPLAAAERYLSWRSGYLMFEDTPLAEAVAEFNRYNERQIVIDDPAVGAIRIGGNFGSRNVDAFVRLIEQGFPVRAKARGGDIELTRP